MGFPLQSDPLLVVVGYRVGRVAGADGGVPGTFEELRVRAIDLLEGVVVVEDQHVRSDAEDGALGVVRLCGS